ncbi:MAG: biotin carboxylase N-terminal domain-containing protein [Prolixibacteraceae bacterium]|jgi:acetyl/propionyl-CoA carboxylase alpha subunit
MSKKKPSQLVSFAPPSEGSGEALLIANRGEIAVRIIHAAQKLGISTVAVYASDDAESLHVSLADEAVLLTGNSLDETYLNQEKIIQIALESGAAAIHPGYGFLSENAGFARKVADAGLVFIGPTPENIHLMGEKNQSLDYVRSLGIPVLPSFRGTVNELLQLAPEMNFPVMVKASGGGGGKGIVICESAGELPAALRSAEQQALRYFGNSELFIEKYLPVARHIEVQLVADNFGNVLHFFERECSVQRHFQKIIEEAPSLSVNEKLRQQLTSTAVKIARSMNYRNAGTIEFLLDENDQFYFLEMNTRIQVEHPVTEMVTKTDLVGLQLLVAAGNHLPFQQDEIQISGHAIEVRLCAEDAENHFLPSAGKLSAWNIPDHKNLRFETFVKEGCLISANYDSLLAKLIVWDETREKALKRMQSELSQTFISGIHTNLPFLSALVESDEILENKIYTKYVDLHLNLINLKIQEKKNKLDRNKIVAAYLTFHFFTGTSSGNSVWNQIGFWRISSGFEVLVNGEKYACRVEPVQGKKIFRINGQEYFVSSITENGNLLELEINGQPESFYCAAKTDKTVVCFCGFSFSLQSNLFLNQVVLNRKNAEVKKVFQNLICADLFGKVLKLNVRSGETVKTGQILLTLESMKTEIHVLSPVDGKVKTIHVAAGKTVTEKQLLVELQENCNELCIPSSEF